MNTLKDLKFGIIIVEIASILVVLGMFVLTYIFYPMLPERIPNHFSFNGMPDGYGDRKTIWMLPVMGGIIYLVLSVVALVSRIVNKDDPKSQALMELVKAMLRSLRVVIAILLFYILAGSVRIALGKAEGLGFWSTPVFLMIIVGILIYYVYRIVKSSR